MKGKETKNGDRVSRKKKTTESNKRTRIRGQEMARKRQTKRRLEGVFFSPKAEPGIERAASEGRRSDESERKERELKESSDERRRTRRLVGLAERYDGDGVHRGDDRGSN